MARRFVNEKSLESTGRFEEIAREAGMSVATLAIAWTLTRDFVASTLIGATRPEQLEDTLAATQVVLTDDVLEACSEVTRAIPYPLG